MVRVIIMVVMSMYVQAEMCARQGLYNSSHRYCLFSVVLDLLAIVTAILCVSMVLYAYIVYTPS